MKSQNWIYQIGKSHCLRVKILEDLLKSSRIKFPLFYSVELKLKLNITAMYNWILATSIISFIIYIVSLSTLSNISTNLLTTTIYYKQVLLYKKTKPI